MDLFYFRRVNKTLLSRLVLKKRSEIHWARKIWHISTVFAMFMVFQIIPQNICLAILIAASSLFVGLDFLRQKYPALNEWMIHVFGVIMRQSEVNRLAGTSYLVVGVTLVVWLCPPMIVSITLLFLAFADPLASYVGLRFGKEKIWGEKTLQGFLAAFVTCVISAYLFLWMKNYPTDRLLLVSLLAGLIGALAELFPVGGIDDNFSMPVMSSAGLYILFYFFGFLN